MTGKKTNAIIIEKMPHTFLNQVVCNTIRTLINKNRKIN